MKRHLALSILALACTTVLPVPSSSETPKRPDILQQLETRYADARTLEVKFLERYLENGRFVRAEAGVAYFLRPGKMRWDYQAPENNMFLVDGKYVWLYSPADRTATRMPAKQSEDWRTPLAFLTSHMKLSRLCAKIEPDTNEVPSAPGDSIFRCMLRVPANEEPSSHPIQFEVSSTGELRRIVIPQQGGIQLEFSFTGWEWNPPFDKSKFDFVPPRGVAIVNGLLPEAPGIRQ